MRKAAGVIGTILFMMGMATAGAAATTDTAPLIPRPDSVDIAPFGDVARRREGRRSAARVEWKERRDVHAVAVEFENEAHVPKPEEARLEYWFSKWPNERGGGWRQLDDPWNGRWLPARADVTREGKALVYRFRPLTKEENPQAESVDFPFRRTLKVRAIVERENPPAVASIRVYGGSVWKEAQLLIEWGCLAKNEQVWDGSVEMTNGRIVSIAPLSSNIKIASPLAWRSTVKGQPDGVQVKLLYAHNADRLNNDRGAVTVRTKAGSFSFFVDDVVTEKALFIRGVGAFVAADGTRYADWKGPGGPHWDNTIKETVARMPEQTMTRVMVALPPKPPQAVPLGIAGGRHEYFVAPDGDLVLEARSLRTHARDTDRRGWAFPQIEYRLALGARPDFRPEATPGPRRWLAEDHLPMIRTEWISGGITYAQSAIVTVLHGNLGDSAPRTGAEPTAFLAKVELRNSTEQEQEAVLWLDVTPRADCQVTSDGVFVLARPSDGIERPGLTAVRAQFDAAGRGTTGVLTVAAGEVAPAPGTTTPLRLFRYAVRLAPKAIHAVYWKAPYLELMDAQDLARFRAIRYEAEAPKVLAHWREVLGGGMQIETPEPLLNKFYRANLWHVLVSTDKDPSTSLYMAPAATVRYDVFPNETCMIARSLEMRGLHEEAARYLEPMFHYQGTRALPGNFKTSEGVLFSAGPYTCVAGYNMHHGFVLWAAAEHYRWTKDKAWLEARLPALLKACNWIIAERQATKRETQGRRVPEYGLAPAGQLEDVEEFQYWYATNAYYCLGLKTTADVLAELGHAEAERLAREAEAYRADILASADEMLARTPAVRLLDGTYVPYLPSRVYARTHRAEGWIREALYCALHLYEAGLLSPTDPRVEWMLLDLEDNIFVRPESGYSLRPLEEKWFDWGGFTLQPNLLGNAMAYLERDETPNFLRAFFNTFAVSLYPDTMCFAEWVRSHGVGGGPLYKTPDECKFVQWLRAMLVREDGRTLRLTSGAPKEWFADGKRIAVRDAQTFFGEMSFEVRSHLGEGRIEATVVAPRRTPAEKIVVRFAHPAGQAIKAVTVNGAAWQDWQAAGLITLPGDLAKAEVVASY